MFTHNVTRMSDVMSPVTERLSLHHVRYTESGVDYRREPAAAEEAPPTTM